MYPEKLEEEQVKNWFGDDFLNEEQYVCCYIHKDYDLKCTRISFTK